MSSKATDRLAKLASFGASAASKQIQPSASSGRATVDPRKTSEEPPHGFAAADERVPLSLQNAPMIRNIAFTAQEQEILKMLMDRLRGVGELTPNLSLAVKVGLRLIPEHPSTEAVQGAVAACKALDGRRKAARITRKP